MMVRFEDVPPRTYCDEPQAEAVRRALGSRARTFDNTTGAMFWKSELLYCISSTLPFALYAIDERTGAVLLHNRRFLELFDILEFADRFDRCEILHEEVERMLLPRFNRPRTIRQLFVQNTGIHTRTTIDAGFRLANGTRVHCLSSQVRDEHDHYLGRFFVLEDITVRAQSERVALQRARLLRAIVAASPYAITVATSDGRLTLWNPAAEHLFGWTAPEVLERPNPALDPALSDHYQRIREQTLRGEGLSNAELVLRNRSGASLVLRTSTAALLEEPEHEPQVLTIFVDVTEQRALEERLRAAERSEAIGQFASSIAHDFNNVLTVIGTTVDCLLSGESLDADPKVDLQAIRTASMHGAELARQLLMFGRRSAAAPVRIDARAVLAETLPVLSRLLSRSIRLECSAHRGEPLWIVCERSEFQQVLLNLVANARDAMPGGGVITLSIGSATMSVDPPSADFSTLRYVRLLVHDTGHGISPEIQARIFEPLFTTKPPGKGTGLGLATVHGIAIKHGGRIRVTSEPGDTTFEILFPHVLGAGD